MGEVWLMRHAPTSANAGSVFMGSNDVEAGDIPPSVAAQVHELVPPRAIEFVLSSPLKRATMTAEDVFPGVPLRTNANLSERRLGEWQGMEKQAVRSGWPEAFVNSENLDLRFTPPGGEQIAEFLTRCRGGLLEMLSYRPVGNVVVVTHNGVIRALRSLLGEDDLVGSSGKPEPHMVPVRLAEIGTTVLEVSDLLEVAQHKSA